jgi:hypothetical protein
MECGSPNQGKFAEVPVEHISILRQNLQILQNVESIQVTEAAQQHPTRIYIP